MNVIRFFKTDPDQFTEPFEPVVTQFALAGQKVLVELGLIKDNGRLHFSIGKRLTSDGSLLILDQVPLSLVSKQTFAERPKRWNENALYSQEFLRYAFEGFVVNSPFDDFIRKNVNPLDITQMFAKLRDVSSHLINFQQLSMGHEKGRRDCTVQDVGS
jgi:hypothetical protein